MHWLMTIIKHLICVLFLSNTCVAQDTLALVNIDTLSIDNYTELGYRNYPRPQQQYINNSIRILELGDEIKINKDQFYPIGISPNGIYAYAIEPYAENCDCYMVEFYIKDLTKDSVVWLSHYSNENFMRSWDNAVEADKDSLRNIDHCSGFKCAWYHIYPELSKTLFEYDVFPLSNRNMFSNDLENQQKFNHTYIDSSSKGHLSLFFQHDIDSIHLSYPILKEVKGLNYHGYFNFNKISRWYIALVSERHSGLDPLYSETWHYQVIGFKRSLEMTIEPKSIALKKDAKVRVNTNIKHPYRHVNFSERMSDRVANMPLNVWMETYGQMLDAIIYDSEGERYQWFYNKSDPNHHDHLNYRQFITHNNESYALDRSFLGEINNYFIYGSESKNNGIENLNHLIAYHLDASEAIFWYDFSEISREFGDINWLVEKDSVLYVAIARDVLIPENSTGTFLAFDLKTGLKLWEGAKGLVNSENFIVYNDILIAGFSDNKGSYLKIVNKYNGLEIQSIKLPSAPLWMTIKNNRLLVKTQISTHEFEVSSTFFPSY